MPALSSDLPGPPIHLAVNSGGQWVDTAGVVLALVAIGVAAYRLGRRHRSWIPVIIPLGALLAGFMEPIYTVVTNLWYMKPGQVSLLSTFGMNLPVWVLLSYCACYGGLGLTVWWMVERGATARQLWNVTAGMWVGFIVLELGNLALGTYTYYGPQPFRIGRFPAWVSLANAAICISIGVIMAIGGRALTNLRQWLLLVAGPGIVAAGLFGTTFPEDIALHVPNPGPWLTYGAAVASTILALTLLGLATSLLPANGLPAKSADVNRVSKGRGGASVLAFDRLARVSVSPGPQ